MTSMAHSPRPNSLRPAPAPTKHQQAAERAQDRQQEKKRLAREGSSNVADVSKDNARREHSSRAHGTSATNSSIDRNSGEYQNTVRTLTQNIVSGMSIGEIRAAMDRNEFRVADPALAAEVRQRLDAVLDVARRDVSRTQDSKELRYRLNQDFSDLAEIAPNTTKAISRIAGLRKQKGEKQDQHSTERDRPIRDEQEYAAWRAADRRSDHGGLGTLNRLRLGIFHTVVGIVRIAPGAALDVVSGVNELAGGSWKKCKEEFSRIPLYHRIRVDQLNYGLNNFRSLGIIHRSQAQRGAVPNRPPGRRERTSLLQNQRYLARDITAVDNPE